MRTAWNLPLACLILAGCTEIKPAPIVGQGNTVKSKDLAVRVEVPAKVFYVGQRFTVKVTATNLTDSPLTITARRGAPVYVHLSRFTGLFEEEFQTYPEAALMVMSQWTLAPHEAKTFPLDLVVAPDWPRGEPLHLTAEINGRPDLRPMVVITIASNPPPPEAVQPGATPKATPAEVETPAPTPGEAPTPAQAPTPTQAPTPKPTPPAVMPATPAPAPSPKPSPGPGAAGTIKIKPYESTPITMPADEGPTTAPTTRADDAGLRAPVKPKITILADGPEDLPPPK
ncbi:MAG: hypothetical protein ACE15C_08950 [Phycisphaerae bacterium]